MISVMVTESKNVKVDKHARFLAGCFYTILSLALLPEHFSFTFLMSASPC